MRMKTSRIKQQLAILTLLIFSHPLWASVTASLPRNKINENETFQLVVSINETNLFGGDKPDTSVLMQDFQLLGQSTRSQSSWINGQKTEQTSWVLTLKAKQPGVFTIPAISVGKQKSQPLSLHVSPIKTYQSNNDTGQTIQPLFLETSIDKSESFVQQQIILSIKFNDSLRLSNIGLSPLQLNDVNLEELSNTSYQRTINGRTYTTYELRYALFPQKSGPMRIPKITVSGDKLTTTSRGRAYEPVRIQSEEITTNIKAIPDEYNYAHWLPANAITLHESFSQDIDNLQVGDAITHTITLSASGLTAEQLPDISMDSSHGLKVYPEPAQRKNAKQGQSTEQVQSSLSQSFSLVVTKAGELTLPTIKQAWFNTQTQSVEIATIKSRTITVKNNPELAAIPKPIVDTLPDALTEPQNTINEAPVATLGAAATPIEFSFSQLPTWLHYSLYAAIGLMLILVAAVIYLSSCLHRLRTNPQPPNTHSSHQQTTITVKQIQTLIDNNDFTQLRQGLINFAQQQWPSDSIYALSDIAKYLNDNEKVTLKTLDASLYSQQAAPSSQALYEVLTAIRSKDTATKTTQGVFKDLYPS